jgi:hypothetical protein
MKTMDDIKALVREIKARVPDFEPSASAGEMLLAATGATSFGRVSGDANIAAAYEILERDAINAGALDTERPAALEPPAPKPARVVTLPTPEHTADWRGDVREILSDDPAFASVFVAAAEAHLKDGGIKDREAAPHLRRAALFRLLPGEHVYVMRFKSAVQAITSYKGLIQIGHASGVVLDIIAAPVYESDEFVWSRGRVAEHIADPFANRTRKELRGVYAIIRLTNGGEQHAIVRADELDALYAGSSAKSPWKSHRDAMDRKTAIKRALQLVALPPRFAAAVAEDREEVEAIQHNAAQSAAITEI